MIFWRTLQISERPAFQEAILTETWRYQSQVGVMEYTLNGWLHYIMCSTLRIFSDKKEKLYTEEACLPWVVRIVISPFLPHPIHQLRMAHPVINHMQAKSRNHERWTSIDRDTLSFVTDISICTLVQITFITIPFHRFSWETTLWQRGHVGYPEVEERNYLVSGTHLPKYWKGYWQTQQLLLVQRSCRATL